MTGVISAYDAKTGKELWRKPGSELLPMFTTHAFSPVVDRGLVIFHPGGHDAGAITAFDVNTGAAKWSWDGDAPGYGSPIVVDLGGTRQLIALTKAKLVGLDVGTGALLWERPFVSSNFTNSATPILAGQTVIVSNGGPVTAVTVTEARRQVDDRGGLDERRAALSPQHSGPDRRHLVRAVHAQQRAVLRRRCENRKERCGRPSRVRPARRPW